MLDPQAIGPDEEQHEYYKDRTLKKRYCAYDYRDHDGKLFSCIKSTLEACRAARDEWKGVRES